MRRGREEEYERRRNKKKSMCVRIYETREDRSGDVQRERERERKRKKERKRRRRTLSRADFGFLMQ